MIMLLSQFTRPQRVVIDQPSTLQPHHKLHGKRGIAMLDPAVSANDTVRIYFTEGPVVPVLADDESLFK